MPTTQQLLDVLRDAPPEAAGRAAILAELAGIDFEHRELTSDEAEDRRDWIVRPPHADSIRFYRKNPGATFHDYLKHVYSDDEITGYSLSSHPLARLLPHVVRDEPIEPLGRIYVPISGTCRID